MSSRNPTTDTTGSPRCSGVNGPRSDAVRSLKMTRSGHRPVLATSPAFGRTEPEAGLLWHLKLRCAPLARQSVLKFHRSQTGSQPRSTSLKCVRTHLRLACRSIDLAHAYLGLSCRADAKFRFITVNLVEATKQVSHLQCIDAKTQSAILRKQNGADNAKENSHRACCSANCCINRAGGGCLRASPHANEGPRGGKRAITEQQCLCRTR
jgi:hypothetical protein